MSNYTNIIKELQKFGLSENQSLIYVSLIQQGDLRIQDIVNITHIPRTSVYEHIKVLLKIGLVEEIIEHKFVRIKAYPISYLKHSLYESLLKTQTLIKDLSSLEHVVKLLPDKMSLSTTTVRYYKGLSAGRQLLWNTLSAKGTMYVYSAYGRSQFVGKKFYKDFVRESKERNITEKVLINPTERAIRLIKRDAGSSLARTKINDLRFLSEENLVIKGETFIYNNIFAQITLNPMGINGFEIESKSFSDMQKSIFETLWKIAKPLETIVNI